jgi:ABC-type polysaccharide/polyol phosphate transport system ATPase subunit
MSPMIEAADLRKSFLIPHDRRSRLKEHIVNPFRRTMYERNQALSGVTFEVQKGEFFGVIGANGSGKSTLLKILAGIYRADAGTVRINGRLSPFIELGVGFNPELSARENVEINAMLLGLTRRQLKERFDHILEFAGLQRFVDQKLKNYSSGMLLRLAYSIAIQVPFDILLLDEVLAVGDAAFQAKCFETFETMREEGKTIVFVSHDLDTVARFCERALLLHGGGVQAVGEPQGVIDAYRDLYTNPVELSR